MADSRPLKTQKSQDSHTKLLHEFIDSLTKRLESFLPYITGYSLSDVELNPQFVVTKRILVEKSLLNLDNQDYITYCFVKLCKILNSINKDSNDLKLRDKDDKLLASSVIILKLLTDLIRNYWRSKSILSNFKDENFSINFNILTNYSFYYHFLPPDSLNPKDVPFLIDTLIDLLSGEVIKRVLNLIQKRPIDNNKYYGSTTQTSSSSQLDSSGTTVIDLDHDINHLISEIDLNIEICLRFLGSANPKQFYDYIYSNLFKFSYSDEQFPIYVLQRYSPLIKYTFYTMDNGLPMARSINKCLETVKNNTWRQIILVFYANSVRDQSFARPEDYEAIVESSNEVMVLCKSMFDQTCSIFEEFPSSGVSSMVQSWISILNPSDYKEYELKPNKLKLNFNKRLKFIHSLVKDSHNKSNLTCFDSLITLYHLAGRFPLNMQTHPIYLFSINHLDETYDNLTKVNLSNFSDNPNSNHEINLSYDNLLVNFFIGAIMLKPEKYVKLLLKKFHETKDNFREVRVIIKVIKGLSESTLTEKPFNSIIKSISDPLKNLVFNASKILDQCYMTPSMINTSSSSASIQSDRASVTSSLHNATRKLSFDEELSPTSSKILHQHHTQIQELSRQHSLSQLLAHHSHSHSQSLPQSQILSPVQSQPQTPSHNHTQGFLLPTQDIKLEELKLSSSSSTSISSILNQPHNSTSHMRLVSYTEDILSDVFGIYKAVPQKFFNDLTFMTEEHFYNDEEQSRNRIIKFVLDNVNSLKVGLQSRSVNNDESNLFKSTCDLIVKIVDKSSLIAKDYNNVTAFANFLSCNYIVKAICDSCLSLSLTDTRFKSNFLFLNEFLAKKDLFDDIIADNKIIGDERSHADEENITNSIERVLLLSLCTHDIQFYNIAKETMKWYIVQLDSPIHLSTCHYDTLSTTFKKIVQDDFVFTGFVSLHKRIRNILRESRPTKSLYQIWLVIHERWLDLLYNKSASLNEENLLFRHFTGFLVSTSGCFLSNDFAVEDLNLKLRLQNYISEFFDKCIELLTSQDLVLRVIVKDALSNESHSAVYRLISTKLSNVITAFEENGHFNEESVLFTEQAIIILTSMVVIPNDGSVVLTVLLPEICFVLIKLINLFEDPVDSLRLKLRFCKLVINIESDRARVLLAGAHKTRNFYAKCICDWLEQAAFFDESGISSPSNTGLGVNQSIGPNSAISPPSKQTPSSSSSAATTKPNSKDSELVYINIDLATESSKALSLQLEELVLEIPEGTLEKDVAKYKDLAFANYFSLFYKILTKYTSNGSTNAKSKYKSQLVVENVLKCITNLLQYDTDIGLQFVFPLGYHENKKIRSLFLSVFADMLYERKIIRKKDAEFSDDVILKLSESYDIVRSASVIASNHNHNLFASAMFGLYGHLDLLDKVFDVLLTDEITNVSRTSDIFRRNSTLTKLLAKLAKDYGLDYLSLVLKDFIQEFTEKEIVFNVEREQEENSNPDLFMEYLNKLVNAIVNSALSMPPSFKYVCAEINRKVSEKVPDSGLIAVGSFIFLRFFCPAIISPESFFETEVISHNNKKSLLQLVKVIQNMANKTLSFLKWKSLNHKMDELNGLNQKIFDFLAEVSVYDYKVYPFKHIEERPVPEMRYLHRFYFTYYKEIKQHYLLGDLSSEELSSRVKYMRICDAILKEIGQPKTLLALQGSSGSYKNFDPSGTLSSEYTDFMNKMSNKYAEMVLEVSLIHNAIFHDGTPVVVMNLNNLKMVDFDVHLLIYKLFETASQVWDNKFYFVFDFTGFSSEMHLLITYSSLLNAYGPSQLFKNCIRIYYFNLPITDVSSFFNIVRPSRVEDKESRARIYTYSHCDSIEIISSLCLSEDTMAITRDKKVEFENCKVLDSKTQTFRSSTIRIGRQFLLLCSDDFVPTAHELCATKGFRPVEIFGLSDITRCEITKASGATDEFTIYFNNEQSVIIRSSDRLEILRFLYFTTSRLPKAFVDDDDKNFHSSDISNLWFGRLFNIVFQSLLCEHEDVRSSASLLFASVANYFEIDYNISKNHARDLSYPANTTDFIVAISEHLSDKFPEMSYRFLRAFFDCYEKLPKNHRINAILYVAPWVDNICDYIYLRDEENGLDRVAGIIRQFCLVSSMNKEVVSAINDYIWKKLFSESILVPLLLDEIVTFAMDNRNDDPDWSFIISVISPSVEICGEALNRLIDCINRATNNDSEIASESKLFEIMILVKICASLFFDSFIYAQLYLADVFFVCTLFIDNPSLEFGADLQKLMINTIQSFLHKPDLTEIEQNTVEETLTYFSGQRAKMLFGLTREKSSTASDIGQLYNRAASFETLCDYLNDFITVLGSADDRSGWRSRWCSYAINVAFAESSLFQVRAMLVVGILSKNGISDHTAAKMLKLMSRSSINTSLEYMTSTLMSAARLFQGLSEDSVFPPIIIWPQLYFGMLNYSSLYQASIQCLLHTLLKNFDQGPGFADRMFEQRKHLSTFIDSFESSHDFHIDERNILCYIFFIFTQGLKLSHIKHSSLNCLQTVFKIRYVYENGADNGSEFEVPAGVLPYLTFIWFSCNQTNFDAYIGTTEYKPSEYVKVGKYKVPKVVVDYLLSDHLYAKLTLYQACFLFIIDSVDAGFKIRFLYLFNHIFNLKREKGFMVYHIIRPALETLIVNSNLPETVELVSDISIKVLAEKSYSLEENEQKSDEFLSKYGLMIMKHYKFRKLSELLESEENIGERIDRDNERLQEMIYRSASSYVENQRLEN